jgi:hypothetical protein
LLLTGSFAFATVALPYCQQVNNHILLLAVTSALSLGVARVHDELKKGRQSRAAYFLLGTLAGMGYTIDLGAGPVILLCTALFVLSCCYATRSDQANLQPRRFPSARTLLSCLWFAAATLPWLGLHHYLNASIGSTFCPANANPEYFRWPGSPFLATNLTGSWVHQDFASFLVYAASMLGGKRGFLGHNLPLFLSVPAFWILLRRHPETWRPVLWALGCCVGTWLLYASTSNNSSGQCCTIRWFVPLLAPAYFVFSLFLPRYPQYTLVFAILSGWGTLLVLLMHEGPWLSHMVPFFWPVQGAALLCWGLVGFWRRRQRCSCDLYATSVY